MARKKSYIVEILEVLAIVLVIRVLIFEPFYIPSGSMNATLLEGDYIFATKYDYGYSKFSIPFSPNIISKRWPSWKPERGDIVIFRPPHHMSIRYIKRLIGLPGDQIQMIGGVLHINGKKVDTNYIGKRKLSDDDGKVHEYNEYQERLPSGRTYNTLLDPMSWRRNTKVFEVPPGHYFFLGDNRDNSLDSRYTLGYVPEENLIAKAKMIYFSSKNSLFPKLDNQGNYDYNPIYLATRLIPWIASINYNRIFGVIYI